MQEVTSETVELAYVDQSYTGEQTAADAAAHGIQLEVVKLPEAKSGQLIHEVAAGRVTETPQPCLLCGVSQLPMLSKPLSTKQHES